MTSEGHGEARRLTPEGARGSLRRVSVVPIERRIEALEPLKALPRYPPLADDSWGLAPKRR